MTSKALSLPVLAGDSSLSRYLAEIKRFPVLELQQEYMLAKRWREHGEIDAAHQMVTSHLRLVAKIAMGYRHYGLPVADLISEGNLGLMQAVKKFDPERGFRLATYAMWWIRAAITEYVLQSWSLVKIGTAATQKRLFFNLRKIKSAMKAADSGDLTPAQTREIAAKLDVSEDDVTGMNRRLMGRDASLNAPVREDDASEWQDHLVDESADPEARFAAQEESSLGNRLLTQAFAKLSERERHILTERRLKEPAIKLETLAEQYGISRERVRQIEVRAFEKLQSIVRSEAAALPG